MRLHIRLPRVRRLQWKLTLTYTLVTTGAILVVEAVLLLMAWWMLGRSDLLPRMLLPIFQGATVDLVPAITALPPKTASLDEWLEELVSGGRVHIARSGERLQIHIDPASFSWAAITDAQGRVLAVVPKERCPRGSPIVRCAIAEAHGVLAAALGGEYESNRLVARVQNRVFVATPIRSSNKSVVGILFVRLDLPNSWARLPREVLQSLLSSGLLILLLAMPVGTLFGFFTARGLTRRLKVLADVADAWGRGDFTRFVHDSSPDELGQVARRLNRMAEELQNLLQTREEWATLEERHRLARDLHDSVKQQVFAAALQLAAVRNLMDADPDQAKRHLAEAERLVRQTQQELAALIRELRPAALASKGLALALEEYVNAWARQSGIHAELSLRGARSLPFSVEQAVFRLVQEALANVAKHSAADRVTVALVWGEDALEATIEDNGRGFDPHEAMHRGWGLVNMHERVQALGGVLHIITHPGEGARIEAHIPLST